MTGIMRPKIYIFIPVFNEHETVGILLYRISELMKALRFEYQVILTLDGCTDESAEVVAQYMAGVPLRVIDHVHRHGYGPSLLEAIRTVLRESENPKRDFFLVLDGDFPVDLSCLEEMAQHIDRNVDLYTADSFTEARRQPRQRRFAQWLVSHVLRLKHCEPSQGATDLLTTVRGCRMHLLARAERELERLGHLGHAVPQAASLIFFLTLLPFSRKFMEVRVKQRRITRRKSRFAPLSLARRLLFTDFLRVTPGAPAPPAEQHFASAPETRPEKASSPAPAGALTEGKAESRSGRRRRRRKSAAERRVQQDGQTEQKRDEKIQPQPRKSGKMPQEKADSGEPEADGTKPASRRRRRRRRPANKDRQGTSNSGESTD
jgi:hypothetical protein